MVHRKRTTTIFIVTLTGQGGKILLTITTTTTSKTIKRRTTKTLQMRSPCRNWSTFTVQVICVTKHLKASVTLNIVTQWRVRRIIHGRRFVISHRTTMPLPHYCNGLIRRRLSICVKCCCFDFSHFCPFLSNLKYKAIILTSKLRFIFSIVIYISKYKCKASTYCDGRLISENIASLSGFSASSKFRGILRKEA